MALCSVGTQWPVLAPPSPSVSVGLWAHTLAPCHLQVPGGGGAPEAPRAAHRASSPSFLPLSSGAPLPRPPHTHPCCRRHAGATCTGGQHCRPRSIDEETEAQGGGGTQGHTPSGRVRPGSAHAVSRSLDDSATSGSGLGAGKADATLQPEASREPRHCHHVPPREAPPGTRHAHSEWEVAASYWPWGQRVVVQGPGSRGDLGHGPPLSGLTPSF